MTLLTTVGIAIGGCNEKRAELASSTLDLGAIALVTAAMPADVGEDAAQRVVALQSRIIRGERVSESLERLGWTFVELARAGHDEGYYRLALEAASAIDESAGDASAADLLRGHALLALHRFAEAEAVAVRLVDRRGIAADHGLLGDARLDLGRVDAAVRAYQRMVNLRPDHHAYARVAIARHFVGDVVGAVDALEVAAAGTSPRNTTAFAWIRAKLAICLAELGRTDEALARASEALDIAPDSADALLARGRILLAARRYADAAIDLRRAAEVSPMPTTLWVLEEALVAGGDVLAAERVAARIVAEGEPLDPRGYASYLSARRLAPARALALARAEIERRSDPHTWDTLASAQLAAGEPERAWASHEIATATGVRDPHIDLHGAEAAYRTNRLVDAKRLLARAQTRERALLPSERARLDQVRIALDSPIPGYEGGTSP